MTHTCRVPGFSASRCGFPFPNSFPPDNPVILAETPFGDVATGDASRGLCGGMVFTAMDLFLHGISRIPAEPTRPVFRYFCRRLLASWNLPFGGLKYFDWQIRPGSSQIIAGIRVRTGVSYLTVVMEWPRVREQIDAGIPAALGLVKMRGWDPMKLGQNHQVLAYGYDLNEATGELGIAIYDPNYPCDDSCTLSINLHRPDTERPVYHSCEGPSIRGFFFTEYRRSALPPEL